MASEKGEVDLRVGSSTQRPTLDRRQDGTSCVAIAGIRALALPLLATSVLAFAVAGAAAPDSGGSVRILSDQPLPRALMKAVEVRWASDASIYLAMLRDGAVETSIDLERPRVSRMIPKTGEPGGSFASRVASSPEYLVATGPLWVTWRRISDPLRIEHAFDSIHDIDVMKDRLVVVAARRDEKGRFAPEGAIAWLGSLSRGLSDLRPVAYDATGPGAKNLAACSAFHMGGARFLN